MKKVLQRICQVGFVVFLLAGTYGIAQAQTYSVIIDKVLNGSQDTLFIEISVAQTGAPVSGAGALVSATIDLLYNPNTWTYGYVQSANGTNTAPGYNSFPRADGLFAWTYGWTISCTSPPCPTGGSPSSLSTAPSRGNPTPADSDPANDVCSPPDGTCTDPVARLTLTDQNLTNPVVVPDGGGAVSILTHAFTLTPTASADREDGEALMSVSKAAAPEGTAIPIDSTSLVLCFLEDANTGATSCCEGDGGGAAGFCDIQDSGDVSLPVELTSFDATRDGDDILIQWQTASEESNAGFSVEHARGDDKEFAELAFVEGHGTTSDAQTYVFRAKGLDIGRHRFRLRQVDFDGAFEYSDIVEATIELAGTHRLGAAYPNPFNPSTTFELIVGRDQIVQIDVINALGQRVDRLFDGQMEANEPKNFVFEARTLPSGLYFYRVAGETFAETKQMLLVK